MTLAIEMHGVSKGFRDLQALHTIDWSVPQGSIYGLIGANGAGKTTLLRLALGLLWPDQGDITVLGEPLTRDASDMRQRMHYVASGRSMVPSFRVAEWLQYASLLYQRWDATLAKNLLDALELPEEKSIGSLSSGMQTSLQLAVALASRPDLLLLDEPTNGLDIVVKRQILQLIIDMASEEGTTVVIATHNIEDIERMADRASVLYQGRFLIADDLDAIKRHMHRIQIVLPGEWPSILSHITRIERQGQMAVVTLEGSPDVALEAFREAGATHLEVVDMDLTEVFRSLLEKEGYTRESLSWRSL